MAWAQTQKIFIFFDKSYPTLQKKVSQNVPIDVFVYNVVGGLISYEIDDDIKKKI